MTRPPFSTWTSWQPVLTPPTSWTSGSPSRRTSAVSVDERETTASRSSCSTGRLQQARRGGPGDGGSHPLHHRRRRRWCGHGRPLHGPSKPVAGCRGHPRGHHRRLRHQVRRRGHPGQALAQGDEERQKAIDAGHDLDRVLSTRTSSRATASSWRPASPTASCSAASATAATRLGRTLLVMRSRSGTIRTIESEHNFSRPGWFGSPT